MTHKPNIKTDYSREELIAICDRSVVDSHKWMNRDTPNAHEKLGVCWAMLKAGCQFEIHPIATGRQSGCFTDHETIWLTIHWSDFSDFEYGTSLSASDTFYLPTPLRLEKANGSDWY